MTYMERESAVCKECGQADVCGYYARDLQRKCVYLQNVMYGWELGQEDTLEAVENYVDRGNSVLTEKFMDGLRQSIDNGKED